MAKREFVQLAHSYNPMQHGIGGWWWSEKLDGFRCFWDGGISRGLPKESVPWANTNKDERFVKSQICSGLWSRYGNVIHAPDNFLDELPRVPLDGELYANSTSRQEIGSIIKRIEPDSRWSLIYLMVFDSPPLQTIFADGTISNIHYQKKFNGIIDWVNQRHYEYEKVFEPNAQFRSKYFWLKENLKSISAYTLAQFNLEYNTKLAKMQIDSALDRISALGGEGVIVRNPDGKYHCERTHTMVKIKKYEDAEAIVVGYVTGRETEKGSKLLGLMGAMKVQWQGKIFEISGFSDEERRLVISNGPSGTYEIPRNIADATDWAEQHPETECPVWISSLYFPRGSVVTFKYRGLTNDGIPNEASYWRKEEVI